MNTVQISPAEMVASLVSGTATHQAAAVQKVTSVRLNVYTLARVDALAAKAGRSRNEMVNMLLDVAVQEVYGNLGEEVIQDLQALEIVAHDLSKE